MRTGGSRFIWPDVVLGIIVFVAGIWAAGMDLLLLVFIVGEQRHSGSDPSVWDQIIFLLLATGCIFAGSQIMVSRRLGFDVAILAGLSVLAWAILNGRWSPVFWFVLLLLALLILRRYGIVGRSPS